MQVAPNGLMAVSTDNFGRVFLLDLRSSLLIRVWKGYRDAQCAWLSPFPRRGLCCLIIYAPRRGLLECWEVSLNHRIGAVNVGLDCRLIPVPAATASSSDFISPPLHSLVLRANGSLMDLNLPPKLTLRSLYALFLFLTSSNRIILCFFPCLPIRSLSIVVLSCSESRLCSSRLPFLSSPLTSLIDDLRERIHAWMIAHRCRFCLGGWKERKRRKGKRRRRKKKKKKKFES